jgi:hypothetical protein
MKRTLFLFTFLMLIAVAASPLLAEDSPFVGTWKLNTAKSKFEPGPAPKSLSRTVEAQGDGLKYSFEGVAGDGSAIAYSFASNLDGTDSAVTGTGTPAGADSLALTRVNSHKVHGTMKKDGKQIGTTEAEVSKDGKVVTVKSKGKTSDGKAFRMTSVYDKQ